MKLFRLYGEAFGGLSTASWLLALIMLINRSGSMIIAFMGLYLKEELGFSLQETGSMIACYGIGSIVAAYLGGWLTDKIGHFKVQFFGLVLGGILCFVLMYMRDFYSFIITVFILAVVVDSIRPANATSVSFYAKPENITRAFALNRMAINLGFAIGPMIGGILAAISFKWLFIVDGATCILAGIVFFIFFLNRKGNEKTKEEKKLAGKGRNPYKDFPFVLFIILVTLFATAFFQLFMTFPLYYRMECNQSEAMVGVLLGLNGVIVFSVEMLIVHILKDTKKLFYIIVCGLLLTALAFFILNISHSVTILVISIIVMSLAEILSMPFMATITVQRSDDRNRGKYMGLYTMSYSLAFVMAPYSGSYIADNFGFDVLWWIMGGLCVAVAAVFYFMVGFLSKE